MRTHLAVRVFTIAAVALASQAQTLVRSVSGPAANALFGKACIVVPDQNADGFKDLLVGAPGFNQQRGAIYCISGAYLASGAGAQTLWSVAPTANPGDLFGTAIADVGDMTGDGVDDFLVGQPGYDDGTSQDVGAVRLINGASHAIVSLRYDDDEIGGMFGSSIAALGDINGDGIREVAIGAPGPNSMESRAYSFTNGALFKTSGSIAVSGTGYTFGPGADGIGAALASGADLDGDGFQEFIVGVPGSDVAAPDAGRILIQIRKPNTSGTIAFFDGQFAGERLGSSVALGGDYDGDGIADIVAGAPGPPNASNTQLERVLVLSSARLIAHTPPYEIYTLHGGQSSTDAYHFGAAVQACADLNHDGVGEILVGIPDYTIPPFSVGLGAVSIFSGASGFRIGGFNGSFGNQLGDALAGAVDDLDGDGFKEFVVAGSLANSGGTDSGVVKCYSLFPCSPSIYCTGKLNSLGCTPVIAFSGAPSASSGAPFSISATNFLNQKNGLLFYSHAPAAAPFQGGTKCVHNPTVRTPTASSGGSTSGSDCTGSYAFDFNAWIANGWDATLAPGNEIFAQFWSRDPGTASHTSLSNAVRFVINP